MTKKKQFRGRRIEAGGITQISAERQHLDIILQSPEVFHFDIAKYMSSYMSASAIDMYNRSRLYDIYSSVLMDLHLTGVMNKRLAAVRRMNVEFRRNAVPDETVNKEIRAPWFRKLVGDILLAKFWGFTLIQFYKNEQGEITYDLIDRKHFDPIQRKILRYETDSDGIPIEEFSDTVLVCEDSRDLGLLAKITPIVLYKRNNLGDWAEFCQIFGMPIREYTYDAGDENARRRLLEDARRQGGNAVYIHPKDSALNLIEAGSKTGTVDLYERFTNMCNTEISIAVLGNTLTTDAKSTGTQALGTVHQKEEELLKDEDRDYVLDVLNYNMQEVFMNLGLRTAGGHFEYIEHRKVDKTAQIAIVDKLHRLGLPISDDYLYETFEIAKPADYDRLKAEAAKQRNAMIERLSNVDHDAIEQQSTSPLVNRLRGFFGFAPQDGAPLEF